MYQATDATNKTIIIRNNMEVRIMEDYLNRVVCFEDAEQSYDFIYDGDARALEIVTDLESKGILTVPIIHDDNPERGYNDFSVIWNGKLYPKQMSEYITTVLGIEDSKEFEEYWYSNWDTLDNPTTPEGKKFWQWLEHKFPGVSIPVFNKTINGEKIMLM